MKTVPTILCLSAGWSGRVIDIKVFAECSPGSQSTDVASILSQTPQFFGTGRRYKETAFGGFRTHRDDVDHTIHRVGAPDRFSGTPNDLNLFDVFERHVDLIP
jgi:hypothetical protein